MRGRRALELAVSGSRMPPTVLVMGATFSTSTRSSSGTRRLKAAIAVVLLPTVRRGVTREQACVPGGESESARRRQKVSMLTQ